MQINIKTSADNQVRVSNLTQKLPGGAKENIIARIALGYSLSTGRRFKENEFGIYDSQGKEYKEHILFDSTYRDFYVALICQAYGISKNNELIPKYIKLHIDHGLEAIGYLFENNPQYTFFDFLIENLGKGIDAIEDAPVSLDAVKNNNQHIDKRSFTGPIDIKIGYNPKTQEPITFCFNNTKIYNNQHIAVAGKSGSGKSQFALEFLRQLVSKTQGQVNFLFLDFKGVSNEDKKKMEGFFNETHTKCINAPDEPFPLNPLSFIDNINDRNKLVGINKFVDIIAKYSNIGKKQQQTLKDAVQEAFIQHTTGEYPSLKEVYDLILEKVGDTRDTLTEIMGRLSEYELFASKINNPSEFLNNNYYLSLSGELDSTVRFTSVFLIINYIFNVFSNMGGTEVIDDHREMRYVLMIDEAHDLFREKKSLEILEVILRKIRSYGVSVFLLSQGIAEYNTANFDFSQECETSFLLPINDMANTKAINKFLGLTVKDGNTAIHNLEKLGNGQAISNMKEYPKTEVFNVVQYWKESNK
ncbi:MAG: DndE family protein [Bacteroidales bacterium]|jgi:DNA sulfur modification protein DndE|nr:DndE family protein [Bacteroidales bacterium]